MHKTISSVALCALLSAQQDIAWLGDPTPGTGGTNAFPFGSEGVRTQQLVPQSVLGGAPSVIQDLFVDAKLTTGATGPTVSQVYYGDIEIRMGLTQLGQLTSNWDTNSPNPTTVYRGPLLVRFVRDQWIPLGLPNSYLWAPASAQDNLVIDFICWGVADTGSVPPDVNGYFLYTHKDPANNLQRAYRLNWTGTQPATSSGVDGSGVKLGFLRNDGSFVWHDGDCVGSSGNVPRIGAPTGTWPQPGAPFQVDLTFGPANSVAALALGFETVNYGGIPLPFDMGPIGAPGCTLWHGPEALLAPVLVDALGNASYTVLFPPVSGVRFYGTWLCIDAPANALAVTLSGFATMTL